MSMTVIRESEAVSPGTVERIEPLEAPALSREILLLAPAEICPNPAQPRRSFNEESILALADSIRRHGILEPLIVRRSGEGYELISGERRLRAARLLGLPSVPCLLRGADERESAELAIIENLQREELNIFEEAVAMAILIDRYRLTQEEIARRLSVSQACVANKLRLLRHSERARALILEHKLTERHARALLRIKDEATRDDVLLRVIKRGMNVAATEAFIASLLSAKEESIRRRQRERGYMKDIRLLYNSIDNALDIARRSGVSITSERREGEDCVELTIRIPKKRAGLS
jgi:ParB family chromosome partitioning protein